ncbi:MAG: acetate/propionate family kinase [Bradymonadaceae bacterium]|nr:acetate/propionate family kinase [Lujinxingiaceae bacterium]
MHILVINCGSSSIKADVRDHLGQSYPSRMVVERVGSAEAFVKLNGQESIACPNMDHQQALEFALPLLLASLAADTTIRGVGHRVVHGGDVFDQPVRIDQSVEDTIAELASLAPLHNPVNLAGIRAARTVLPDVPHVAVFDTGFHATLPKRARTYALPFEIAEDPRIRRFGFHGISHGFVASRAADFMETDVRDLRLITCHLGNGASIAAVEYGRSIETSMGMTPLEGLVMGTRSGDVDPGIIIHLMRSKNLNVDQIDDLLNRHSGLAGLSGVGNDMRDIERRASDGDDHCRLAIQVFTHRLRKYIGAYAAVMGGVDAIVFTAGIGENSVMVRHRIAQRLDFLGARIDEDRNREVRLSDEAPVADISKRHSRVRLLVVATDESQAIAEETVQLVLEHDLTQGQRTIPVAISARHVHLTQETIEKLFGPGHQLTIRNELSQPGQYAAEETVNVIGPRNTLQNVRILGPPRNLDQVEVSRTDEFFLGIDAPVRASGDIEASPGIILEGPDGQIELAKGVICAWRHIHMTPDDAMHFGVRDRDVVEVALGGGDRDLVFGDVLVRVSPSFRLEMHIDTDEGNAANLGRDATGMLISTTALASLTRRQTRYDRLEAAE